MHCALCSRDVSSRMDMCYIVWCDGGTMGRWTGGHKVQACYDCKGHKTCYEHAPDAVLAMIGLAK